MSFWHAINARDAQDVGYGTQIKYVLSFRGKKLNIRRIDEEGLGAVSADKSMGHLQNALNFADLAMQELGLENSSVVDMFRTATGQSHEQLMLPAGMRVETDIHGHSRTRPIVS